jgi:hypothetical protein
MKIVSFIEEDDVIRKILKHCNLWKEPVERPPPQKSIAQPLSVAEPALDYTFFEQNCR